MSNDVIKPSERAEIERWVAEGKVYKCKPGEIGVENKRLLVIQNRARKNSKSIRALQMMSESSRGRKYKVTL